MKKIQYNCGTNQKRMLFSSVLFIIIMSQLNINFIINGFKISLGIIFIPLLKFLINDFPVFKVTLLSAPGVLLVRCIINWLNGDSFVQGLISYAPEMVFILLYGGLFALYTKYVDFQNFKIKYYIPIIFIDFFSNICEMMIRVGYATFTFDVILRLITVAVGRTLLAMLTLGALDFYGFLLLKKDDKERYKKLLLLISQLKSEVVWMDKNTFKIEETMATAYSLYNSLKNSGEDEYAQKSLTVAKDVHEIKKEYYLIMKGITNTLQAEETQEKGMSMKYILQILEESINNEAKQNNINANIIITCNYDIFTDKHYYLMSVFRNILTNALEASKNLDKNIVPKILMIENEKNNNIEFTVQDNCGGIDKTYLDSIFTPGFSTKINYQTGEVNRGLGLCLVKDIIENELKGHINVTCENLGTKFYITIPKNMLEVKTK